MKSIAFIDLVRHAFHPVISNGCCTFEDIYGGQSKKVESFNFKLSGLSLEIGKGCAPLPHNNNNNNNNNNKKKKKRKKEKKDSNSV